MQCWKMSQSKCILVCKWTVTIFYDVTFNVLQWTVLNSFYLNCPYEILNFTSSCFSKHFHPFSTLTLKQPHFFAFFLSVPLTSTRGRFWMLYAIDFVNTKIMIRVGPDFIAQKMMVWKTCTHTHVVWNLSTYPNHPYFSWINHMVGCIFWDDIFLSF